MITQYSNMDLYKWEMCLYLIYSSCAAYVSICILYVYLILSIYIQPIRTLHPLRITLSGTLSVLILMNTIAILLNIRINYKYRNFRIKGSPENPTVVYMMCLPLLILTIVSLLYILIYDFYYIDCNGISEVFLTSSIIVMFIAMILLLLDTNGIFDTGECWILNLSNWVTIFFSLITLSIMCTYNLILIHVFGFIQVYSAYFGNKTFSSCAENHSHNTSIKYLIFKTLKSLISYYQCIIILLSLTFVPYFVVPLQKHFRALQKVLTRSNVDIPSTCDEPSVRAISCYDIIFNVVLAAILVLATVMLRLHSDEKYKIYTHAIPCVELMMMLVLSIYILTDEEFWQSIPKMTHTNFFEHVLLWLGVLGELVISFAGIFTLTSKEYLENFTLILILRNIIQILQAFLQVTLISFILRRRFVRPLQLCNKRMFSVLNPILNLTVLNLIYTLSSILSVEDRDGTISVMWQLMFREGIINLSFPLTMLYRLFCSLMLVRVMTQLF